MKLLRILEETQKQKLDRSVYRDVNDEWFSAWDRRTNRMSAANKLRMIDKLLAGWKDYRNDLVKETEAQK